MQNVVDRLGIDSLSSDEVRAICEDLEMTTSDFCNKIAIIITRLFLDSKLDFTTADTVANNFYGLILDDITTGAIKDFPEPADSVYLAFDAGEYYRPGETEDHDPVERYTKPRLKEIIANRNT